MIGASELADQLKKDSPEFKIGFIGSHVSALPQEVIKLSYVDFAFINEGVFSLLSILETNLIDNIEKIPGIWFKDKDRKPQKGALGKIVLTNQMDKVMPGYAWDLLPKNKFVLDKYRAHFWHTNFLHEKRTPFAAIYTSLGCQFGCNFCMINIVNRVSHDERISAANSKGMRFWSPELILKEFEKLWEYGVRTLRISDEMFFLNRKYYVPILEGLINEQAIDSERILGFLENQEKVLVDADCCYPDFIRHSTDLCSNFATSTVHLYAILVNSFKGALI